ncbi:MAG: hypothetical protein WKG06_05810 [Segetibacter sp.]
MAKQLTSVLSDIENYAINECKMEDVPFEWYFCEDIGSETYLHNLTKNKLLLSGSILIIFSTQIVKFCVTR